MIFIKKTILLILLCSLVSCSNMQRKIAYNWPDIEPPKLLFDSGILQLHRQIKGPLSDIAETLKLSPDGRYLATTMKISEDLIFWDLKTGRKIRTYKTRRKHDNKLLMSGKNIDFSSDNITVFIKKFHGNYPKTHRTLTLLNLETNKEKLIKFSLNIIINNIHFSPDGNFLASSQPAAITVDDKDYGKVPILQLIDAKTWKEVASVKKGFGPTDFHFTKNGKYIIDFERAGDEDVSALKDEFGKYLSYPYYKHKTGQERKLFMDKYLSPEIRFWSVPDLKLVKTFDNVFVEIHDPYFDISPDNRYFAATGSFQEWSDDVNKKGGGTRIFNLATGAVVADIRGAYGPMSFSYSGKHLIVGNKSINSIFKIYDTKEWQLREQLNIEIEGRKFGSPVAISDNGKRLAMRVGRTIYTWTLAE